MIDGAHEAIGQIHELAEAIGEPTTPGQIRELVGVHLGTVYRWLKGDSYPSPLALAKLKAAGVRGPWEFREPRPRRRPSRRRRKRRR